MTHIEKRADSTFSNYHTFAIVALLTGFIMAGFALGRNLLSLLGPTMVEEGVFDYKTFGMIAAANQLGYLLPSVLLGRISTARNSRYLLILFLLLLTAALFLYTSIRSSWMLGAIALVMGMCTAGSWLPQIPLVQKMIAPRMMGRVIAVISSGTAFGIILIGLSVPLILSVYEWPWAWAFAGVFTFFLVVLGILFVPRIDDPESESRAGRTAGYFMNNVTVRWFYLMMFLSGLGVITFQTYLAPYISEDLAQSTAVAGGAWSAMGVGGMLSGFAIGYFADKTSIRSGIIFGHLLLAKTMLGILILNSTTMVLMWGSLFGFYYFGTLGLFAAYLNKTFSARSAGTIYGLGNLLMGLGGMGGNALGGIVGETAESFGFVVAGSALITILVSIAGMRLPSDARPA